MGVFSRDHSTMSPMGHHQGVVGSVCSVELSLCHLIQDWESRGMVLLSLSYNTGSKKLSVVMLRAKDLKGTAKGLRKYTFMHAVNP